MIATAPDSGIVERFHLETPTVSQGTDQRADLELLRQGPHAANTIQSTRLCSTVQFVSQVSPLSSENDCSHRAVAVVTSDHR